MVMNAGVGGNRLFTVDVSTNHHGPGLEFRFLNSFTNSVPYGPFHYARTRTRLDRSVYFILVRTVQTRTALDGNLMTTT